MGDSLVTARVSAEKKDAVARILRELGVTPSGAINQLYDYVLENKALPFGPRKEKESYTWEEVQSALEELEGLSVGADSRFRAMTNEEILRERAVSRGLVGEMPSTWEADLVCETLSGGVAASAQEASAKQKTPGVPQ